MPKWVEDFLNFITNICTTVMVYVYYIILMYIFQKIMYFYTPSASKWNCDQIKITKICNRMSHLYNLPSKQINTKLKERCDQIQE